MEKNIFDKQFVYFMWDDSLKGKKCFVADDIDMLQHYVGTHNDNFKYVVKEDSDVSAFPFCVYIAKGTPAHYRFVYYDPLYDVKWAWKNGEQIQARTVHSTLAWLDMECPDWSDKYEYRIKPKARPMTSKKRHGSEGSVFMNIQACAYVHGFQDGTAFGYSEANEWHYVKDGDLPKEKGTVLIYWKAGDIKCASVVESSKVTEDTHIIAWKEIVLPELKED